MTQLAVAIVAALTFAGSASAQTVTYVHTDHLGSPVATTNPVGQVLWSATRTSFGDILSTTGQSTHGSVGYTGGEKDAGTGFIYLKNRFYDPEVGRFLSVDPVRFEVSNPMSFNRYLYVNNNPHKYIDPTGEKLRFAPGSTPAFKAQFAAVIQYHNKHRTSAIFARLEARPEIVIIKEGTGHQFSFNTRTDTITFDPTSGLQVSPGNVQTPALGVLHEAAHAESHLTNPAQHQIDRTTFDPVFNGSVEERDATQNVETPAAKKIGEPIRTIYTGPGMMPFRVACPTCRK